MEGKYRLVKEYCLSRGDVREGYRQYQKKYVYPKSYIFMALFLVLAANFVYGAVNDPKNLLAYLLVAACLAFAFREWYSPRLMRRRITETAAELEKTVYRLSVADTCAEIETVYEETEGSEENIAEDLPAPSRIAFSEDYSLAEYDDFFIMFCGKTMFYIIPKTALNAEEQEIIRKTSVK